MRVFACMFLVLCSAACNAAGDDWAMPLTMEEFDALPDDTESLIIINFTEDYWGDRDLSRFANLRCLRVPAGFLHRAAMCSTVQELEVSGSVPDDRFSILKDWENLRRLRTDGVHTVPSFHGTGLQHLADLSKIEELDIWNCSDAGAVWVAKCANLRRFRCGAQYFTDRGVAALQGLKHLQRVDISGTNLTDVALKSLSRISSLEEVSISYARQVTDDGLEALGSLKSLRILELARVRIVGTGLKGFKRHPSIEVLDLSWTNLALIGLENLATCERLRLLDLEGCKLISTAGLSRIVGAPLRSLNLRWVYPHDENAADVLSLFKALEVLDVECSEHFDDASVTALDLPKLRVLKAMGSGVKTGGSPSGLPSIDHVEFGGSGFTGVRLSEWVDSSLRTLRLTAVEDLMKDALAAVRKMRSLEDLELSRAPALEKDSWVGIASLPALRSLDLSQSSLPGDLLSKLACKGTLQRLNIGYSEGLTTDDLEAIVAWPKLTHVTTWGTAMTDDQLLRLVKAHPRIEARVDRSHDWKLLNRISREFRDARVHTQD